MQPIDNSVTTCPNCMNTYSGNYCSFCGQKNSEAEHYKTFRHWTEEFLHGFFHYDGKIFKAIKCLLIKPGFLSEQYFKNRHQAYIKPFTLLLLFTLFLYFFGLKLHILHQFSIAQQMKVTPTLGNMITNYIQEKSLDEQEFIHEFDAYKIGWQKLYYTLLVPFTAMVCALVFIPKRSFFFVDHIVFSIHTICTYLLLLFIYLAILVAAQFTFRFSGDAQWGLRLLMLVLIVHTIMAVKKAYAVHWAYAAFAGFIIAFFIVWMDLGMHNKLVSYLTYFFNYSF